MKTNQVSQRDTESILQEYSMCDQEKSLKLAGILLERMTHYNRVNKFCEIIGATTQFDLEVINPILNHYVYHHDLSYGEILAFFKEEKRLYELGDQLMLIVEWPAWEIDYDIYSSLMGFPVNLLALLKHARDLVSDDNAEIICEFEEACRLYFFEGNSYEQLKASAKYLISKLS